MKTTRFERVRAEQVSAAVEQLVRDPDAQPERLHPEDAEVLATVRRLARLPELLGPVEPALEQRVLRQVRAAGAPSWRLSRFKLGWAAAGLVAAFIVVMLLTPLGQTAVASLMAVFDLGRTEVRVAPAYTPSALPATAAAAGTAVQESLTLEEAQSQILSTIPQPTYLPPGYQLQGVNSYTYPDLPAWVPQPVFVELVYADSQGDELILRVYPIILGDEATIAGLNLEAATIQDVQDVEVKDQPGVLLRLGTERAGVVWQEVVWEQDDLILGLSSVHLAEADLLRIARSVR